MTTLLERCQVAPPPGALAEQSLPLTILDIVWVHFHPISRLLFYEFPCSKPYFLETLVPKLKQSLSLTLRHFFPLAGNIVYPLNPEKKPVIRYRAEDSVPVTISESSDDFDILVGNHARDADQFYDFIPILQQIADPESDQKLLEALAIQVTLFPGRGVCIGIVNHHGVGDASFLEFIRSWAMNNKLGAEEEFLIESLPVFDRSLIKYPQELDSIIWKQVRESPMAAPSFPLPTNRVRATYVFTQSEIKKLKDLVQTRIPGLVHVSSFVVIAAYVWTCLAKARTAGEQEKAAADDDDQPECFLFAFDLRARLNPPVPGNYFGNCVSYGLTKIQHQELVRGEGFFVAAQAVAEEIKNRVSDSEKILEGVDNWMSEIAWAMQNRILSVSGSTRVDLYSADFGWGKVRKMETLSIDGEKYAMSLRRGRDSEGGFEVGLSLPKVIMDAFAALFNGGIESVCFSEGCLACCT